MRQAVRFMLGAATVYVVVAACGSGKRSSSLGGAMGAGGVGGDHAAASYDGGPSDGNVLDALADAASGIADALTDPVSEAAADPPTVDVVACDRTFAYAGGTTQYRMAFVSYPGRRVQDLAQLRAVGRYAQAYLAHDYNPPEVTHQVVEPSLFDGGAAIFCGADSDPNFDQVTFVLPAPVL